MSVVVETSMGTVFPGGVLRVKDGTAVESASVVFTAALERPEATLNAARDFLNKRRDGRLKKESKSEQAKDLPQCSLPSIEKYGTLISRIVTNKVPVLLMSDHAHAATAVNKQLDQLLQSYAEQSGVEFEGTDEGGDADHKVLGVITGAMKGVQEWLTKFCDVRALQVDDIEYGTGAIVTMFKRQVANEVSPLGAVYEFGQCQRYTS